MLKLLPQDEEDVVDELRSSEEYRELLKMKHIKRLKEKEAETGIIHHYGYSVSIILEYWNLMSFT